MKNIFVSKNKNKLLWLCFFILIALGSIWAITASNENFSFKKFTYFIKSVSPIWVGLALVSIIFYILCEGWAITCICKSFGHKGKKTAPDAEAIQPPRPAFRFTKVINGSASDHVLSQSVFHPQSPGPDPHCS